MSSNPQHIENLNNLKSLGFDVDEYLIDTYESWGYDEQVCMVSGVISEVKAIIEQNKALREALSNVISSPHINLKKGARLEVSEVDIDAAIKALDQSK